MKKIYLNPKQTIAAVMLVVVTLAAAPMSTQAIANDATPSTDKITITSENLDTVLFANNPDVIMAMNNIMKAKDQINIARAQLLPSLSLNLILAISNPPMFLLNTTSCLVPFLFPSLWFDYAASKHRFGAEVLGFHLTKLNVYSQAFALVIQVNGDELVLGAQTAHVGRLDEYVKYLQLQSDLGVVPQGEVMLAQLELGRLKTELFTLRQLVDDERAALRKLFGLKIDQEFDFAMSAVTPSTFETESPAALLPDVVARAPERLQIDQLIAAAQSEVRSAYWAWLGGCQGSSTGYQTGGNGGAFSASTGLSINIGFGYYPRIQLAKHNVTEMVLRKQELGLELGRVVESTLADISEIKGREAESKQTNAIAERMLADQMQLLPLGRASVRDMLQTYNSIDQAHTTLLASDTALDGHRITLKRVTLEDGFLKVYIDSRHQLELPDRGDATGFKLN